MVCTYCGNEAPSLNILDDETRVCNGCLDAFYFREDFDDDEIDFDD